MYGEVIAAQLGLVLLDVPPTWLAGLPEQHLRRSLGMSTLAEVRTSLAAPTFVKPSEGRKAFEGRVYRSPGELPAEGDLPPGTSVIVSEPVTWEVEFRCHVLDGAVVATSPYLRDGELALTEDGRWHASDEETGAARAYVGELLGDPRVSVPPAIVIDAGRIRGRDWAVVEANAAWGAGLYGCDPAAVLRVLARSCVRRERLAADDRPWVAEEVQLDAEPVTDGTTEVVP